MNALLKKQDTVVPTEQDAKLAAEASRTLARLRGDRSLKVRLDTGEELVLPKAAGRLLAHLLAEMAAGNAVTLFPIHAELTTQEAADFLNVSRPHLVQLLESERIPFHKVGTHRRVKFSELMAYKAQTEETREAVMTELAEQAQELGMGY